MIMEPNYDYFRTEGQLETGVYIWIIVSPMLICFGLIGNTLSIIVLSKKRFAKMVSTTYLLGLSFVDMAVLIVGLLRQWVKYTFEYDVRFTYDAVCKIHAWLVYVLADCSVWILVMITVERVLATLLPHRSKSLCSNRAPKIVLFCIVIASLAVNVNILVGYRLVELNGNATHTSQCKPHDGGYEDFYDQTWHWIDLAKFSLVPFVILSSGNACIVYKVVQSGHKMMRSSTTSASTRGSTQQRNARTSNMSVLLVCLNVVFIVCTLPICIYFIGNRYWIPQEVPLHIKLKDPWWAVVNMLLYTNNACNFVMYCFMGSRFRNEVKTLFDCACAFTCMRKETETTSHTSDHTHSNGNSERREMHSNI
ncbi:probable G-protein coupled receptor 139 [Dreissena polymorpha]|uniref:G-protein coupled receptors family 1 profile domain-containing protein n=1 Tax=Dreissena polymorpha TaxID=45954 RepID=A0A9D4MPD1_DREPO|nr:probable G-protein coupled receptor 139 [Dreissena polymorpha]KAH3881362.1 hypothetical protein DPMN_005287 [Dreissena polymorpha]